MHPKSGAFHVPRFCAQLNLLSGYPLARVNWYKLTALILDRDSTGRETSNEVKLEIVSFCQISFKN